MHGNLNKKAGWCWVRRLLGLIGLLAAFPAGAAAGQLAAMVQMPQNYTLCGEAVPGHLQDVRERFEKEMLLTLGDQPQVLLWLKREPRYLPFIAQALKAQQMPDDLKYLAVVESALRPHAGSSKGAMGFWQLMPETARKYGLSVNEYVDERRNLYLSTPAAILYLQSLYEKFSSWTLALAAYNMGEEGLRAEMLEQETQEYYQLYLPLETQRFVFRMIAIKLILSDPATYGFEMPDEARYQPTVFDTVELDSFQEVPIRLVAVAAGTYFKVIKDLNPQLRGHYIQPGRYQLSLPQGALSGFRERFDALVSQHSKLRQKRIYVVRHGDSLSTIADKFEVPLQAILIWNRLNLNAPIYPGDRLVIYPGQLPQVIP
jgi:membrane-bound lytic murein transglycosylase D